MSLEDLQKRIEEEPVDPGWRRVTADEWAEFTSDYICYQTERCINGRDTMLSRVELMGSVVDIAQVQYIYTGFGMIKNYLINEGVKELIKYRLRCPVKRNEKEPQA